ncbi:single-strand binding family protein [Actinomyces sp. oral taxon 848 str. F0332]|uniref:Single-stranded DNA-binding protein n=1 Tax=Peptidiphaga gingivicola TaxID=2741497 RepID=A0A179B2P8_9ACTO|nr:single-stranded DNA-binding protein [Peptidiphaga gingivicola]EEZ79145.1 single-strand binding family protein [Actinomyces sp. oral taxon 848 str. F0332]OAP85966.1 single-stranded DNA-binding protein [Peptidiphaga gingivicola]
MAGEPIITVVGNLTGDPELRYVSSGTPVASFTVASTPRTLNRQTQQWEDGEAMFIRCSVWREHGENVAESLSKGMRVLVTGRLTVRSYEYNGQQRTSLEMQVDEIGPSLRYARAQVTKVAGGGSGGGNFGGGNSYQGGGGYGGGRASYDAPQGGSAHDPWSSAPQGGSAFDDNPPF